MTSERSEKNNLNKYITFGAAAVTAALVTIPKLYKTLKDRSANKYIERRRKNDFP